MCGGGKRKGGGMDVDIKNPSIQMDIYMPKPIHRYIE